MYLRHERKFASQVSLSEPIGYDGEGNEVSLMDVLPGDGEDVCEKVEKRGRIRRLYENVRLRLEGREKEVITLRYGLCGNEPMTQRDVAERLGISRSYVSRIEKRAIGRLKDN